MSFCAAHKYCIYEQYINPCVQDGMMQGDSSSVTDCLSKPCPGKSSSQHMCSVGSGFRYIGIFVALLRSSPLETCPALLIAPQKKYFVHNQTAEKKESQFAFCLVSFVALL
jgi:hypothetical protein